MNYFAESATLFDDNDLVVIEPTSVADDRQRLRNRFDNHGPSAIPDYELLELILFRAIPHIDVKPLALSLLGYFGDLNRVLSAAPAALAKIRGCGPNVISELKLVEATAHRMARAKVIVRRQSFWDQERPNLRECLAHLFGLIMRRAGGDASVALRVSSV